MYNVKIFLGKRDGNFVIHERRQNFCSNDEIIFYTRYISLLKCILRPKYFSIRDNWITFSMRYEIPRKKKFHIFFFFCFPAEIIKIMNRNENTADERMKLFFLNAFNDEPISGFNELQVPLTIKASLAL